VGVRNWSESNIADQTGKRVLVTGSASGIGFEAARALAEHGAHVIVADRNAMAGAAVADRIRAGRAGASVEFRALDLSDLRAVGDFAAALVREGQPLDTLINNAGIQPISERRTSVDGFELTFAIGHLGHFLLTGLLLPLLEQRAGARIVTVSSMVHGSGRIDWDDLQMTRNYSSQRAYNQTKLANLLFARELARRLERAGSTICSLAVHPGVARTAIGANRRQLGRFHLADYMVSATLGVVMPYLGQSAAAGALPTMFAACSPNAENGGFYGPCGFGEMKGWDSTSSFKHLISDDN